MAISADAAAAKQQVDNLGEQDKRAVVRELNAEIFPTGEGSRTLIWVILIAGLLAIAVVALLVASNEKNSDAYIAVSTLVIGGIIGLFSKSPVA